MYHGSSTWAAYCGLGTHLRGRLRHYSGFRDSVLLAVVSASNQPFLRVPAVVALFCRRADIRHDGRRCVFKFQNRSHLRAPSPFWVPASTLHLLPYWRSPGMLQGSRLQVSSAVIPNLPLPLVLTRVVAPHLPVRPPTVFDGSLQIMQKNFSWHFRVPKIVNVDPCNLADVLHGEYLIPQVFPTEIALQGEQEVALHCDSMMSALCEHVVGGKREEEGGEEKFPRITLKSSFFEVAGSICQGAGVAAQPNGIHLCCGPVGKL